MVSSQNLVGLIVSTLLCLSPLILLGIVGAATGLLVYRRKQKRSARLKTALGKVAGTPAAGIESVAMAVADPNDPLSSVLITAAQQLRQLAEGDPAPLEERSLSQTVSAMDSYRQYAASSPLPSDELRELGDDDLTRLNRLADFLGSLVQAAETGDTVSVHKQLLSAIGCFLEIYGGHRAFCRELAAQGIMQFPLPQPVRVPTRLRAQVGEQMYIQILSQLPKEQRMPFIMRYNNVQKKPTMAVLLAILLGGIGAHQFYMGRIGLGVAYLLFSWTWIPTILGFVEALVISGQVHKYNAQKAAEISQMLVLAGS